jgi:hypothetical protein
VEIVIEAGAVKARARLADTAAARRIYQALPLRAVARTWGDEIYFDVPVEEALDESAQEVVAAGDLGYWPSGPALCVFFGPTPISRPGEIRPASAVNIVGRLLGEPAVFKAVSEGMAITVSRA